MDRPAPATLPALSRHVLAAADPESLWELQKELLVLGGEDADRARGVARAFHACLRTLESKSASREASRWGAVLGTAAVGSVSLPDLLDRQEKALTDLLQSALPAVLEVGAALQMAQAWEVEAQIVYDQYAWFLYEELWDVSAAARPDLAPTDRRARIDALLDPLLDGGVPDADRAHLMVEVFRSVLAARLAPLIGEATPGPG